VKQSYLTTMSLQHPVCFTVKVLGPIPIKHLRSCSIQLVAWRNWANVWLM